MSITKTILANMALAHIGKVPIDKIDDPTETAEWCKLFIDIVRQAFIRQSKLYCTRKEVALSPAAGETSSVYDYVYGMPSDCLAPIEIWNGDKTADPIRYEIGTHSSLTSKVIKTDEEGAVFIYSVDITNLDVYMPDAILAMSYLLAIHIAMPLKVDNALKASLSNDYIAALSIAMANDQNDQNLDIVNNARFSTIEDSRQ